MSLSELAFGSFLAYCPRGEGDLHRESRRWRDALKNDAHVGFPPRSMTTLVAERMSASLAGTALEGFFGPATVLVPVPGSSMQQPGQLWVPKRIAEALVRQGLAAEVQCVLRRVLSVRKSATAAAEDRPKVRDHLSSFAIDGRTDAGLDLVLVDDIVTRGATLMAAATRLREAFPGARVRSFAVMRAISEPDAFAAIRSLVIGAIHLAESGECFRRP